MSYQQSVFQLISSIIGQNNNIVLPIEIIKFTGDYHTAALLSQLIYWQGKQRDPEDWIYKTYDQWQAELMLSKYQTSRAAKSLVKMGILETKVARVKLDNGMYGDKAVHYRLKHDEFAEKFTEHLSILESKETSLSKIEDLHLPKSSNSTNLPINTETTSKDYDDVPAPPAPEPPKPKPEPNDPAAAVDHIDDVFSHFVPTEYQKQSIKEKMNAALKNGHSKGYIHESVLYANDKSTGGSWQKYRSFLGKTLDFGWAVGYGQEVTETKKDRDAVMDRFKQMPDKDLKFLAGAGNSFAAAEIERRKGVGE